MIDKVQVGDKLIVYGGYSRSIVTVEKVTPSGQFTGSDGNRYTARGDRVGASGRNRIYTRKASDADIQAVNEEQERRALQSNIDDLCRRAWMNEPLYIVRAYAAALADAERVAGMMGKDGVV